MTSDRANDLHLLVASTMRRGLNGVFSAVVAREIKTRPHHSGGNLTEMCMYARNCTAYASQECQRVVSAWP